MLKKKQILALSGMAVFFAVVIGGYFFPSLGAGQEYSFLQEVFGLAPDTAETVVLLVRKLGHLLGYAFLCWSFLILLPARVKNRLLTAALLIILIAGLDEYFQSMVSWRSGQVQDVILDLIGASLVLFLTRLGQKETNAANRNEPQS